MTDAKRTTSPPALPAWVRDAFARGEDIGGWLRQMPRNVSWLGVLARLKDANVVVPEDAAGGDTQI